jgi:hypothetical protein
MIRDILIEDYQGSPKVDAKEVMKENLLGLRVKVEFR